MWESPKLITTIDTALKAIECHYRRFKNIQDQDILIYIGVDEYQNLTQKDLKRLMVSLGANMTLAHKNQSFIILPFFSGTDSDLIIKVINVSSFTPLPVPLGLLLNEDVSKMLDQISMMTDFYWLKNWRLWSQFRRCIEDFQGMYEIKLISHNCRAC